MKNILRRPWYALVLLIALACLLALFPILRKDGDTHTVHAQSTDLGSLSGYAWSDNLGWISLSGSTYQVTVQSDGTLAGYAWANPSDDVSGTDNIGWISFNAADTASCGAAARLTGTSITGWAKVLSADNNGWDGCISLSGSSPAYGVTLGSSGSSQSGMLGGYAWADSTVGGWISFNCATGGPAGDDICATRNYAATYATNAPPPPTVNINEFTASPARVRSGGTSSLLYMLTSDVACGITGSDGSSYPVTADGAEHAVATNIITGTIVYTLSCGSVSRQVTVGLLPVYQEL